MSFQRVPLFTCVFATWTPQHFFICFNLTRLQYLGCIPLLGPSVVVVFVFVFVVVVLDVFVVFVVVFEVVYVVSFSFDALFVSITVIIAVVVDAVADVGVIVIVDFVNHQC